MVFQAFQTSQDGKLLRVGVDGGTGGAPFSGEWQLPRAKDTDPIIPKRVQRLDVWSDGFTVHGFQVVYPDGLHGEKHYMHGQQRDTQHYLVFAADEYIEQVSLRNRGNGADGRLRNIKLKTSKGRVLSSDGNDNMDGDDQVMYCVRGYLAGFDGRSGVDIDKLEVIIDVPATEYSVCKIDYDIAHSRQPKKLKPQEVAELTLFRAADADPRIPAQLTQTFTNTTTDSGSWGFKVGGKVGVKTTAKTGIPFLLEGKIEISGEVNLEYTWGSAYQTTRTITSTANVTLPADVTVANAYVLQYSTQLVVAFTMDVLVTYMDGDQAEVKGIAGEFTGVHGTDLVVELKPF